MIEEPHFEKPKEILEESMYFNEKYLRKLQEVYPNIERIIIREDTFGSSNVPKTKGNQRELVVCIDNGHQGEIAELTHFVYWEGDEESRQKVESQVTGWIDYEKKKRL